MTTPTQRPPKLGERLVLQDGLGRYVFFPWGQGGSGYYLPDRQSGERTRRTLSYFPQVWLWTAMLSVVFSSQWAGMQVGLLVGLVFFGLYLAFYGIFSFYTIRGKPRSVETYQEIQGKA
jgi:hypothetical protein